MEILMGIMIFVIGLCCGSFVNMLIYRTEERYGITNYQLPITNYGRSFCDFCGRQLNWWENIPVVSWMFLKGRSRCCNKKLPIQYPLVELTTGILFLIFNLKFEIFNEFLILNFIIITLLIFAGVFDFKHMILPDFSTYLLIGISLLLMIMNGHIGPFLLAGLGACLFLLLLHVITKGRGMGLGDVKFALFMGLLLGWQKVILAFYLAFIGGAVIGVILMANRKLKKGTHIPFGPFLIGGTILAYLFGENLLYYVYGYL